MEQPWALLVDGDNVSPVLAAPILAGLQTKDIPAIARVYTDAQKTTGWAESTGFRVMHAGCGKNAADILLAVDAMELALTRGISRFAIASSDGDFRHLAQRLREHGAEVIGLGEAKAPKGFRGACTRFVEIAAQHPPAPPPPVAPPVAAPTAPALPSAVDRQIRGVIAALSTGGKGVQITTLSTQMKSLHGVQISAHPEKTWRGYLSKRPTLYDLDAKGPAAMVRFRPAGFAV